MTFSAARAYCAMMLLHGESRANPKAVAQRAKRERIDLGRIVELAVRLRHDDAIGRRLRNGRKLADALALPAEIFNAEERSMLLAFDEIVRAAS